jgi:DNA mismatch repair protein MutS
MKVDSTTLNDLGIFKSHDEGNNIFNKLNFTETNGGRDALFAMMEQPFDNIEAIQNTQQTLKLLQQKLPDWPKEITNGCVMVIEKYYDTGFDTIPTPANMFNGFTYRTFHFSDYSLIKFSIEQFWNLFKGYEKLIELFENGETPTLLSISLNKAKQIITNHRQIQKLLARRNNKNFTPKETIYYGNFFKGRIKHDVFDLLDFYFKLDAWKSMVVATINYQLVFPTVKQDDTPYINGEQVYHPLLPSPTAYDIELKKEKNFLFLTGANMAGKSTYIKSVGLALYLTHLGMAVPATKFECSFFDGLLSNIHVMDNIAKGESYFYNEVQRIKKTVQTISNGSKWLVLIDELFKGTNVQDAMKCSSSVIQGLLKIPNCIFIVSTHLYEIGEDFKAFNNIIYRYFETHSDGQNLVFSYQLKEGISNDRLGYLILKREGVVDMLESLGV